MKSHTPSRELVEQLHECQIEIAVLWDAMALLLARLIAAGAVDADFLGDLAVCADGLDHGRNALLRKTAPPELRDELHAVQHGVKTRRDDLIAFVEQLARAYRP